MFTRRILLLLICLLAISSVKAATELSAGVVYEGGSKLKVSALGVQFEVPENWQAILPQGAEALFMEPGNAIARIIVSAVPDSSEADIRQELSRAQDLDMHTQLVPVGRLEKSGEILFQQYRFEGFNAQKLAAKAYARLGSNNTAFILVILESEKTPQFTHLARQLVKTVKFSKPVVAQQSDANSPAGDIHWEQQLKGRTLKYMRTSNGLSVTKVMNLCSDYRFSYSDNDSYVSSSAISDFSASGQAGNHGRWHIEGNQITLQWSDGSVTRYTLSRRYVQEWDEWGTFVDEDRWFNLTNNVCS